ncbi:3166_t:CDS:1 [Dentiscutata erythropus]|uniref:3166_t:CDS:1 n=1 Tax=Dentiscutata erythropus TaxID=1348616 RepID=A0A9N9IKV8_9GLOM|nr:3166_t:CDS:1 [Dentiscutata erythropus]
MGKHSNKKAKLSNNNKEENKEDKEKIFHFAKNDEDKENLKMANSCRDSNHVSGLKGSKKLNKLEPNKANIDRSTQTNEKGKGKMVQTASDKKNKDKVSSSDSNAGSNLIELKEPDALNATNS